MTRRAGQESALQEGNTAARSQGSAPRHTYVLLFTRLSFVLRLYLFKLPADLITQREYTYLSYASSLGPVLHFSRILAPT